MCRRNRRGSSTVEFALIGIPLIFSLISIVEISRGMWIYHSQIYAVKEAVRYVVVHGVYCSAYGNTCTVTVGSIATKLENSAVGLPPGSWNITLVSASGGNNVTCNPLSSCESNTTTWPPSPDNAVGSNVAVVGSFPFTSALAMFWPGSQPVKFGTYNLPAYSQQSIQY